MRLTILAVGHRPAEWVNKGCAEYIKRMPRELPLAIVDIKPATRGTKTREQLLAAEKERLLAALNGYDRTVILDEKGDDLTTLRFAERLEHWLRAGGATAFVIGGADGVDASLKRQAHDLIRLSSLTLPHALARLILCEQLYRAASILRQHPYHREA